MKLGAYGLIEVRTFKTFLYSLIGIRTVQAVNRQHSFKLIVVGVPPWRPLEKSDIDTKKCYEVK